MAYIRKSICLVLCAAMFSGCYSAAKSPEPAQTKEIVVSVDTQADDNAAAATNTPEPTKEPYKTDEYNISLEIDPESRIVTGIEKLSYQNRTEQPMDKIYFNVYLNAFGKGAKDKPYFSNFESKIFENGIDYGSMDISNVTINSQPVDFSIAETALTIILPEPVPAGESIEIALLFEAYIPKINHRTGANGKAMWFGNFIPTVAVYDSGGWHTEPYYPAGDPFYSNMSNFTVKVTTPKEYIVAGTGEETATETGDKRTTFFSAKMVRDFAFAVSKDYKIDTIKTDSGIYVNFYYYSDVKNVDDFLYTASRSLDYYGNVIGAYPYLSFDIVEVGLFMSCGMEYPELTFIDSEYLKNDQSIYTLAHEIAHQYFYNIVGNNQIKEAWLDEGLASYVHLGVFGTREETDRRMQAEYDILNMRLKEFDSRSLTGDLSVYKSWSHYYNIQYNRSMLMIYSLRNKMGDEKFDEFIKVYYTKYSFKKTNATEFISTAEEVYGEDLTQFFKDWMEGHDLPPL